MRDIQCRSHVCRTCLSRLAKPPAHSWIAPFSSRVFQKKKKKQQQQQQQQPQLESSSERNSLRYQSRADLMRRFNRMKAEKPFANDDTINTRGNPDFSVRYFEQDGQKRKELANEQAFGDSFGELDASELGSDLSDFQSRLRTADEKGAFNAVLAGIGERWDNMKTTEDLERMIAKMQIYTQSIDKEIEETGADLPKEIVAELLGDISDISELPTEEAHGPASRKSLIPHIPEEGFTAHQRIKISQLNKAIRHTCWKYQQKVGLSKRGVQMVWGAYHMARKSLSRHWSYVPLDVWDHLWKVLATEDPDNTNRLDHIAMLSSDMSQAKVTLTPPQQLLAIEAVFVGGWEDKAISNWRRCVNTIGAETSDAFQDFWELGARMFCRVGDMEQAERAIDKLLDRRMDPRILLTLIRTCCEQGTAEAQEKAWVTYRRMRELLGKEMKLSDYDQVVAHFLTENQVENGLYAFVDMMSDGRIDLKNQKQLPSVIANKFFFGKWLKRLIGAGNLDGAHKVIEFMEREKIEGASIQVNGLVGAWLRSGGSQDVLKADALAWRMIEARIQFVRDRNASRTSAGFWSLRPPVTGLPRATMETFYLLAENYRQRGLHAKLEALWDAFRDAELKADTFMMNQLLESHMAKGQWKDTAALYRYLVEERGVVPDPYSFSALWKTLAINRLQLIPDDHLRAAAAAARSMFGQMVKFKHVFPPEGMDGQLARKILHSFRRLKDQAGMLVALLALRDVFSYLPTETLVMELLLDTTKLSWDTPQQRRKLMLAKRNLDHELRTWAADGDDGDAAKLEGEKRGEALYHVLQKKYWSEFEVPQDEEKKRILIEMAKEMGVYDLLAPKKDAGNVVP